MLINQFLRPFYTIPAALSVLEVLRAVVRIPLLPVLYSFVFPTRQKDTARSVNDASVDVLEDDVIENDGGVGRGRSVGHERGGAGGSKEDRSIDD